MCLPLLCLDAKTSRGVRELDTMGADAVQSHPSKTAKGRAHIKEHRPLATGEVTTSGIQNVPQLSNHKVKIKKAGQRACNEKNAKGKFCGGHLKRWFYVTDVVEKACGDVEKAWGTNAEVYRCENCKALYLPTPGESKVNVAGQGMISVFGLTLPPKEKQ